MKKLVLTTVCALAMAGAAFAQGTVSWSGFGSLFIANTNSAISPLFGGTGSGGLSAAIGPNATAASYYFELLYTSFTGTQAGVPSSLAALFAWSDSGLSATNGPAANGRIVGNPANTAATVPWANGVTNSIMLVGWSANLGTTWGVVSNELKTLTTFAPGSFFGMSATGYINPNPANPGATVFASSATSQGLPINNPGTSPAQLFLLPSVPEPATMALAGLGGLSLMLFRRQRKS